MKDKRFEPPHRFEDIGCSDCGESFGSGNYGFSHCKDHEGLEPDEDAWYVSAPSEAPSRVGTVMRYDWTRDEEQDPARELERTPAEWDALECEPRICQCGEPIYDGDWTVCEECRVCPAERGER